MARCDLIEPSGSGPIEKPATGLAARARVFVLELCYENYDWLFCHKVIIEKMSKELLTMF